jgi:hypothetical protein
VIFTENIDFEKSNLRGENGRSRRAVPRRGPIWAISTTLL